MSSDLYPTLLAVECDMGSCGTTFSADFLVSDSDVGPARYEGIYSYVEERGWEIFRKMNVAYCPEHADKGEY